MRETIAIDSFPHIGPTPGIEDCFRRRATMPRSVFHAAVTASFLLLLLLCSLSICAQSGPPQHPPRPILLGPAKWNPSPQEVSAPYWTLESGWNTELEMRNNLRYWELTITPVLRSATGQELSLAPVTVAPQHVVSLD